MRRLCASLAAVIAVLAFGALPANAAQVSWQEIAEWELAPDSLGAIRVGMTVADVERATGRSLIEGEYGFSSCQPWTLAGAPGGLGITTSYGKVVRIDIHSRRWTTTRGIRIGDPAWKVKRRYGVRTRPHTYTRGRYLITRGKHRFVFETSSRGKVTRFRAGRPPYVEYVEGCL